MGDENQLAIIRKDVVDVVTQRVQALTGSGDLHLPKNYSAENAMKSAWLKLQELEPGKLENCTPNSIANALLDMVVQGLSPAKDQVYFIPYGKKLTAMRSYYGTIALLRRVYGQETEVAVELVYEGDEFKYTISGGKKLVTEHGQTLDTIETGKIRAAYCVVTTPAGATHTEVMTMSEIQAAWAQGATKGKSPAHTKFPGEMCKKTVINRAVKVLINASDDAYLVRAIENQATMVAEAVIDAEAEELGNVEDLPEPEPEAPAEEPENAEDMSVKFTEMCEALELAPDVAKGVVAAWMKVEGEPGNDEFAAAIADPDGFVNFYIEQTAGE